MINSNLLNKNPHCERFRKHHTEHFFYFYEASNSPLDFSLYRYFKKHRAIGSKDRAVIAEKVYQIIRWKSLIDFLCEKPLSWNRRIELLEQFNPLSHINNPNIPLQIRLSFPKELFSILLENYGQGKTREICLNSNEKAPTTIRVNTLKIKRDAFTQLEPFKGLFTRCIRSSEALTLKKPYSLFSTDAFKKGFFEIQDEASQLSAQMLQVLPGEKVLDYCAGSGGKTLAFAPKMQGKGQIYLHDIRSHSLEEAKKRLKRAGIQNAQIIPYQSPHLKALKKKMDWVLVDAPCSGTGTLRRNPDMKWKFSLEMLRELVGKQRSIFESALSFVKPQGHIVYATCSFLPEENEKQLAHFLKTYPLTQVSEPFYSFPQKGLMDGFFCVVFKRNTKKDKK